MKRKIILGLSLLALLAGCANTRTTSDSSFGSDTAKGSTSTATTTSASATPTPATTNPSSSETSKISETTESSKPTAPASSATKDTSSPSTSTIKPLDLTALFAELNKPMTVTGSFKEILIGSNGQTTELNNTQTLYLGSKSYHIEVIGDSYDSPFTSSVYKDETTGDALHYYITNTNEVAFENITDDDGNNVVFNAQYGNPFQSVDITAFEENFTFSVMGKLSDQNSQGTLNQILSHLTNMNFIGLAAAHTELSSLYSDFSFTVVNNHITSLHVLTNEIKDQFGTEKLEYTLNFDTSENESHDYPLPTPFAHTSEITKLQTGLDELIFGNYTYSGSYIQMDGVDSADFKGGISGDTLYLEDDYITPMTNQYGYVFVNGHVATVSKDEEGNYTYLETKDPYNPRNYTDLTEFNQLRSVLPIAVELFQYDSTQKVYTLDGQVAGIFGKSFNLQALIDPATSQLATHLEITLDDNNHVTKMHYTNTDYGTVLTINYDFKNIALPFNPSTVKKQNPLTDFVGNYTGTITNSDSTTNNVTIAITSEKVTFNGTDATDYILDSAGYLYFTADGKNYKISSRRNSLYNADDSSKLCDLTYSK